MSVVTTAPVLGFTDSTTRSAHEVLAAAQELAGPAHRGAVDRLPEEIRHIAGYHAGWWDAEGRPRQGGGKAVRPALVLASAWAAGGEDAAVVRAAVPAAVAVELVHDFSLLHDDIMDGDLTRRHRPAAWSVFGVGEAILAGDVLLTLALDLLAGSPGLRVLTGSLLRLCSGQSADLAFESRTDVTLAQCVEMAAGKTGALLGCACEIGALAGGADQDRAGLFGRFGRHLGLAFQLTDDLLGIWGDPAVTGKPVFSDLAGRKKSLPVVAALTSGTPAGERLARLYHGDQILDERSLAHAADLVEAAGARAWAQREAEANLAAALACLRQADPAPEAAGDLRLLAQLIIQRDR
ncbi:polyprenyl synthetase family protein [Streptosporangium roseum]|uniref:polyprenyl synthetase family protein n=1 Tax=Streptosporangium roseum TaxID=2001 RepID=UPI0009E0B47A